MNKSLLLIPSTEMDSDHKKEDVLVRMSKETRETIDFDKIKEVSPEIKDLNVFKAFTRDLIKARQLVLEGVLAHEDLKRVGFVSFNTFNKLGGQGSFIDLTKLPQEVKVEEKIVIDKLLIGTDPELLLMLKGEVYNASQVAGLTKQSKFGCDGPMAELRPDPALDAKGLVENIRSVLQNDDVQDKIHKLDLISSCYHEDKNRDYPVGTHIHIDNPKEIAKLPATERYNLFAVTNRIIDELLTLPMIRLDGDKGHNRRAKCKMSMANGFIGQYGKGYGYFGEWRECNGRLEHRSLSGLVLSSPELAEAVFGTAKAIAEAVYTEALQKKLDKKFILPNKYNYKSIYTSDFAEWAKIPLAATFKCVGPSKEIADMMDASDRSIVTQKYIKDWLVRIRELSTYTKFSENIEALGEILSSSNKSLDSINKNLKQTWKD